MNLKAYIATFLKRKNIIWVAVTLLSTGCVPPVSLTVLTEPEGGYISGHNGRSYGIAPVVISYDFESFKKSKNADGCFVGEGFVTQWVSGASKTTENVIMCPTYPFKYQIKIDRGTNAPDLDKDLQFAMQVKQSNQKQSNDSGVATALYLMNSFLDGYNQGTRNSTINCSSYKYSFSNSIDTTCTRY
jgi:hypothetical protein